MDLLIFLYITNYSMAISISLCGYLFNVYLSEFLKGVGAAGVSMAAFLTLGRLLGV
jgi:hypothetical protein